MHYYQHHIGDFMRDTSRLKDSQCMSYLRLIWMYYDTEMPLVNNPKKLAFQIGAEVDDVELILEHFFYLDGDVWRHRRCDEEIIEYKNQKENHWARKLTKEQRCAIQANRNARKLKATPTWLTEDHKRQISDIYALAAIKTAETGISHEVDHIIPLRGKFVCGLHVPSNLQILPAYKNRQKSNSLTEIL